MSSTFPLVRSGMARAMLAWRASGAAFEALSHLAQGVVCPIEDSGAIKVHDARDVFREEVLRHILVVVAARRGNSDAHLLRDQVLMFQGEHGLKSVVPGFRQVESV